MSQFNVDLEALIRLCNSQALEYLAEGQHGEALALLRKAESYFSHPAARTSEETVKEELMGITMTNLGGYYRQRDKHKVALYYLSQGLAHHQIAKRNAKETARTYIGLCAVYSAIGQHSTALTHVQAALTLLDNSAEFPLERATAYHNKATELEHMGRLQDSLEAYSLGLELAGASFPGQSLHIALRKGYENVKRRYEMWTEIAKQRKETRGSRRVPTHFTGTRALSSSRQAKLPHLALSQMRTASTSRRHEDSISLRM
jgi:tetratricopeptide (TPR) repeat protein